MRDRNRLWDRRKGTDEMAERWLTLASLVCAWLRWWALCGFFVGVAVTLHTWRKERKREAVGDAAAALARANMAGLESAIGVLPAYLLFPDYEKVHWINQVMEKVWPLLAEVTSRTLPGYIQPLLDEYCPSGISQMNLKEIQPGTKSPVLGGIKSTITQENEAIFDLDFKWGGNQRLILDVRQAKSRVWLSVSLERLLVFGHIRIVLTPLIAEWPLFARVQVSLLDEPSLDFSIKALGGTLTAIPGIEETLKKSIRQIVHNKMVWPKALVFPVKRGDFDTVPKYQGVVFVRLVRGVDLKHVGEDNVFRIPFNLMDPFVVLKVRDHRTVSTPVFKNERNPVFNLPAMFLVEDCQVQELQIKIFDYNLFGDDELIGTITIPLQNLAPDIPSSFEENVIGEKHGTKYMCGQIIFETLYMPYRGKLTWDFPEGWGNFSQSSVLFVVVNQARRLPHRRRFAPSHPRAYVSYGTQRKATKACKSTTNPVWDEKLEFVGIDVTLFKCIKVEIYCMTRLGRKGPLLGWVEVALSSIQASGGHMTDIFKLNGTSKGEIHLTLTLAGVV